MPVQTLPVLDVDDLDLTACVVGVDAILDRKDGFVLYTRQGRAVREVGHFQSAVAAWDALEALQGCA
jgi:hypothetical protein